MTRRPLCARCGEAIDRRRSGLAELAQRHGRRVAWRLAWHMDCVGEELAVVDGQLARPDPLAVAARGAGRVIWGSAWSGERPA